jgi:hypothetical protein
LPQPEGTDFAALWEATPPSEQRVRLLA